MVETVDIFPIPVVNNRRIKRCLLKLIDREMDEHHFYNSEWEELDRLNEAA